MSDKVDLTKKSWDPDDPELSSDMCAYEGSCYQRMIWARWSHQAIAEHFGCSESEVRRVLATSWHKVREAWRNNRPIYASVIPRGFDFGEKLG